MHDVRGFWYRRGRLALLAVAVVGASLLACSKKHENPTSPPPPSPTIGLQTVQTGLAFPLFLTSPPGDTARLFVVEKGGVIRIIKSGTLLATPFLDISGLVSTAEEQGLLGLAFDPAYATNGRFYVSYTDASGDSRIVRYLVSSNPDVAVATADRVLLPVVQPEAIHNGGMIAFGPDGKLYVGLGDGGGQGDPYANGQDKTDLLGSILRLDVSGPGDYGIPVDNPFLTPPDLGELWDDGLRNPWRFSFDRQTGDLYIGDVGQDEREELDVSTAASGRGKGLNYGWPITEGNDCYGTSICDRTGLTAPVLDYGHGEGCAVVGGYVYRGAAIPSLRGTYFYGDHCQGWVRSFRYQSGVATEPTDWTALRPGGNVTSFGEDARGELYVMTLQGGVYRIVAR